MALLFCIALVGGALVGGCEESGVDPSPDAFVLPATLEEALPLAEALGSAFTQLFGLPTAGVEIRYGGDIGRYRTELPTLAFLKGLLSPIEGDEVNLVNGRYLAQERGIELTESRATDAASYTSLVTVRGRDGSRGTLAATLVAPGGLRLTEVDGFEVLQQSESPLHMDW